MTKLQKIISNMSVKCNFVFKWNSLIKNDLWFITLQKKKRKFIAMHVNIYYFCFLCFSIRDLVENCPSVINLYIFSAYGWTANLAKVNRRLAAALTETRRYLRQKISTFIKWKFGELVINLITKRFPQFSFGF